MTKPNLTNVNALPDEEVVAALEDALDLARTGELRSVAIVGDLTGNRTFTNFATHDMMDLIAQLSFLHHTICARQRENREADA